MTHLQKLFIENLRFFRTSKGVSQLQFSEMVKVTPNYMNAIENGKNFPSADLLQRIIDALGIQAYQLFLERSQHQIETQAARPIPAEIIPDITALKEKLIEECNSVIAKYR